jgi:hypothetical protein
MNEIGKIYKCSEIDTEEYELNNSISIDLNGTYSYDFSNTEMNKRIDNNNDYIEFNIKTCNNNCGCKCCYSKCKCSFKYYNFVMKSPTYYDFCVKFNELTRNHKIKCNHIFIESIDKNNDGTYDISLGS